MRVFLLIFTCFLVAGIVLFAMVQAPHPQKSQITVSRIELHQQPLPVLQSDPAADYILDFFPEPSAIPRGQADAMQASLQPASQPTPSAGSVQQGGDEKSDLMRLLALIDDWVYLDYSQIGSGNKMGTIHKTRENEMLTVYEGKVLNGGIQVTKLADDAATLQLGKGTFQLRRAEEPSFYKEVKERMKQGDIRPLTKEEQDQAYDYYMKIYGDKFRVYSENYQPTYGTQNPTRVTEEVKQQGLQDYYKRYGQQRQQESQQFKASFPYTEQQKENYKKYWQTFFPDRPMPDFDQIFSNSSQQVPGSRVVTDDQSK